MRKAKIIYAIIVLVFVIAIIFLRGSKSLDGQALNIDTPGKSPLAQRIRIIQQNGGRVDWSPSGNNLIAFDAKNSDGYFDLYTMTPAGAIVNSLTSGNSLINQRHNGDPVWHPSGKYIIFKSEEQNNYAVVHLTKEQEQWIANPGIGIYNNLWAAEPDGSQFWKLTFNQANGSPSLGVLFPRFSHDGKKLVWSERYDDCYGETGCQPGINSGKWRIKIADFVDSKSGPYLANTTVLLQQPLASTGFYVVPMGFSPDDTKLLVAGNLNGQHEYGMDEYILNIDTKTWRVTSFINLTNTSQDWEEGACWSPDGRYIIYMSDAGSNLSFNKSWTQQLDKYRTDYYIMNADGSNKQRLTYFNDPTAPEYAGGLVIAGQCVFSPDGAKFTGLISSSTGIKDIMVDLGILDIVPPLAPTELTIS